MRVANLLRRFYWECRGTSAYGELTVPLTGLGGASGIIYGTIIHNDKLERARILKSKYYVSSQVESALVHGCVGSVIGMFWFVSIPSYCVYQCASSFKKYSQLVNDQEHD